MDNLFLIWHLIRKERAPQVRFGERGTRRIIKDAFRKQRTKEGRKERKEREEIGRGKGTRTGKEERKMKPSCEKEWTKKKGGKGERKAGREVKKETK
mgnify:CR=1 FL=1